MKSCSPSLTGINRQPASSPALQTLLITILLNALAISCLLPPLQAVAQIPLPGGLGTGDNANQAVGVPNPGQAGAQLSQMAIPQRPVQSAPLPGNMPLPSNNQALSAYQQLPLNTLDAQTRLETLKQVIATAAPSKNLQESIYQLCEWLTDMANAHYKLASVFAKHDATKVQSELERKQAQKFSQLKNQAQLLKSELLIRQSRYPEALGPLIDIVAAEPRSATGQQAYKRLQQIGFSEEAQPEEVKQAAQTESTTSSTQSTASSATETKSSATISRASTVSVEGYVGAPAAGSKHPAAAPAVKTAAGTQANKGPAPSQPLNVR